MSDSPLNELGFDKIYCVSLDRRKKRRKHALKQFQQSGIENVEIFPAIDAVTLDLAANQKGHMTPGMIGCYLSHYMIMREAIYNGYERILVFEDDLLFIPGCNQLLSSALPMLPTDAEFAYLGYSVYSQYQNQTRKVNKYWVVPGHCWGTQGYMVMTRSGIEKIWENIQVMRDQIDVYMTYYIMPQLRHYAITPAAIVQSQLGTDVQGQRN